MEKNSSQDALTESLERHGLTLRGQFTLGEKDGQLRTLLPAKGLSLALIGNAGSSLWPVFSRSDEYHDGRANPLDRWSQRIGDRLAVQYRGVALYPFGQSPPHPFISWAQRAGQLHASPLGLGIDPRYGLWPAFRFALILPWEAINPSSPALSSPCEQCSARSCLTTCPVNAFSGQDYAVNSCYQYLLDNPSSQCQQGCLARQACPVVQQYTYTEAHANFHMRQFIAGMQSKHTKVQSIESDN